MIESNYPVVAIVVLTWNQRDLTLDCLASLAEMDYPSDKLQIIVVDNGSNDNTPIAIQEQFSDVIVIENGNNLGFAEGNNVGIHSALQGPAGYIMLLNNDTVIDKHMLTELLSVIESSSTIGIVGPKMLYFEPDDIIWCAGNRINWHSGKSIRLHAEEPDTLHCEQPLEVDFITACAILLRRSVIEEIGLLDTRFFLYYEETDWCVRAHKAGWRIFYVPSARLWHKVSATIGATSPAIDYYMNRNVLLFLAKHLNGFFKVRAIVQTAGRNLLAAAAYTFKSYGGQRTPNRNARLMALRDAILGRWGKMGEDVARICHL